MSLKGRLRKAEEKLGVGEQPIRVCWDLDISDEDFEAVVAEDPDALWIRWRVPTPEEIEALQNR
jgi:hypothetical protein